MRIGYVPINSTHESESLEKKIAASAALSLISPKLERVSPQVEMCPANLARFQKLFLVRSSVDMSFETYENTEKIIFESTSDREQYDRPLLIVRNETIKDGSIWITVQLGLLFLADESVTIDLLPAFLHGNKFEVAMGSFDIFKWQRTLDFTFKYKFGDTVKIKVGDPLYYISFACANLNERITLEELPLTELILNQMQICIDVKEIKPKASWAILSDKGNKFRPKNFLPKLRKFPFYWK